MRIETPHAPVTLDRIARVWWPLAASWLLMGAELPALSAVIARLPNPEINLAAYGGVVFPLALIIESPIIMLLAASTALCKDWPSYRKLYRFMMLLSAALTLLHVLVAFTPLYYVVVRDILGVPEVIVAPARVGLMIMTPWTWAIAYRRFQQGVLIRFGHSRSVGVGTVLRMFTDLIVLAVGYSIGTVQGVVVATSAVVAGVLVEAVYAGWAVRPVLRDQLRGAPVVEPPLTYRAFYVFYIPLVLTSLLSLLALPIGSAALSRMPQPVVSLAVWPVVTGFVFMLRGLGIAFNEVVVALLDEVGSSRNLERFTWILAAGTTLILLFFVATPASAFWFRRVSALSPMLAGFAVTGLWIALPMPALSALQSWFQGSILYSRRTRGITEAVAIFLAASALVLIAGISWGMTLGLYVGLAALVLSTFAQTLWLGYRSRPIRAAIGVRDATTP